MVDDGRTERDFRIYSSKGRIVGGNPTIYPYTPLSFADPKIAQGQTQIPRQEVRTNVDPNFEALGLSSKVFHGLNPEEMRDMVNSAYRKRAREVSGDPEELKRLNIANDNLREQFGMSR